MRSDERAVQTADGDLVGLQTLQEGPRAQFAPASESGQQFRPCGLAWFQRAKDGPSGAGLVVSQKQRGARGGHRIGT
jgi:hypothetical protein